MDLPATINRKPKEKRPQTVKNAGKYLKKYKPEKLTEMLAQISELEEMYGVSKEQHPVLQKLTVRQYLFVLRWCDPDFVVVSRTAWNKQHGFREQETQNWLSTNPNTTRAITYLSSKLGANNCIQLAKVLYKKGLKEGNIQAIKLYLEHFKPVDEIEDVEVKDEIWDMSDWDTENTMQPEERN